MVSGSKNENYRSSIVFSFAMNYCGMCQNQLAPDDFDGICSDCDHKCRVCHCELLDEYAMCQKCEEKENQISISD